MQGSGNNEDNLKTDLNVSASAEAGSKLKKRGQAARVKPQRKFLKNDNAKEGCEEGRTYTAKKHANRKQKGASSASLTETNDENNSSVILDKCAKNHDGPDSANYKSTKKMVEVNTPIVKESCAASKKRKVNSAIAKSESSKARRKKLGAGPNCNQESKLKKSTACSSYISDAELVLRKCKTTSQKLQCAFCQSSECSEVAALHHFFIQ